MRLKISLEHWQALIAVVEEGSYASAAILLNKSQSTVNYSVAKIEEQLNIKIFNVVGRHSELTPVGQLVFRQAKNLVRQAGLVEERVAYLAAGWEPVLKLAVDIIFPPSLLLNCMEKFSAEPAAPPIELYESVLGGTTELIQKGTVDMAICSQVPTGFVGDNLMHVEFVAAAAPCHPLFQLKRKLRLDDLRAHRQLVIRDSGTRTLRAARAISDISESRWTVSNLATSIRAACMGNGFAWFPKECIRNELESGELISLPLDVGANFWTPLYLIFADPEMVAPGAQKLAEIIRGTVANTRSFDSPDNRPICT